MGQVSESIYSDGDVVIPMAEVLYIERRGYPSNGFMVVFKGTTYNSGFDDYNNVCFLPHDKGVSFKAAWCRYRHELEKDTLMDLRPDTQPQEAAR